MLSRFSSKEDKSSTTKTLSSNKSQRTNPNKESSQVLKVSSQVEHAPYPSPSVQLKWRDELSQISEDTATEKSLDGWLKGKMGIRKRSMRSTRKAVSTAAPEYEQGYASSMHAPEYSGSYDQERPPMFIQEEVRTIKNMPSKMRPKQPRAENEEEKKWARNDIHENVENTPGISDHPDNFIHYQHMNHNCFMP